ncbi:TKL protein kinase [Phytophthora cinnamomi]|uniref:TKL protein kinase n=1 Tax=Phytophthora cinnamomi TaxID=4785 RepID=UPI0035599BC6|nr:TKL protein kinase [Phytophthora cinnamomi]
MLAVLWTAQVVAMTPPVCMDSTGLWGGGTLLSSCSGQCRGGLLCDVAVDGDYTCFNYTDSAFVLLIRDSGYQSDEDAAARVADASYVSKVAKLPDDTDKYPHIDNCYLYDVSKLEIESNIDQVVLAGGNSYRAYYKGRVGYLTLNSDFIANQSQITRVSLINLNLKDVMHDLPSKLPVNTTQLDLKNTLIYAFPTQLAALASLEDLSLEGNYISSLNESDVIPTLKKLNLAANNLTSMPASLMNHANLENLNLGSNKIETVTTLDSSNTLTTLNLSDNNIATFDATYPNLETLYLGSNNLTEIPATVYNCTKLKNLYLSGSGSSLLSPVFTDDQFQFLQNLDTLDVTDADFDTQTACQTNNTQQLRDTIPVCLTSEAVPVAATIDSSSGGMSTGVIIAITAGGAVLLLILLVIGICVCLRRRRAAKFITAELDDPQLVPLMLKPGDIKNVKKIGAGVHCVVWLVRYRKSQLLASKRLRKDLARRRITKAFIEEIKLAAPFDHPSVVKLVGIAWTVKTDIQALYEYVDNGNVSDYLTRPGTLREWTQQKLQIALEVAEALVYLHSFAPPVLHRDLRASNVLLTSDMKAKVSKVGVSHLRAIASGDNDQQTTMGPWQAPEVLMGSDDRDPAVDIFSFGVLLSELDTHAPPYNDARSLSGTQLADAVVLQMIAAGAIRLRFGEDCPPDLRSLADSCLAKNPRMRPAASEVVYALRTIKKLV